MAGFDVDAVRSQFAALQGPTAFFDTPGGSQVPDRVRAAIDAALRDSAANLGGPFATSQRVGQIVEDARAAAGRFLGCDADAVIFGQNMTSLNFALSRAFARGLEAGDELVVTRLDHDASVSPWLEIAHDVGAIVRIVDIDPETCALDYADLEAQLSDRTRVVSFSWAANSVGSVIDAARVCAMAHEVGALAWIDATHYAAHGAIDVEAIGADVLLCSPYKVCGPHLGLAYGRPSAVEGWRPYKVRAAPDQPIGHRFETGTQPYEQLAGFAASIAYLESFDGAAAHEHVQVLGQRLLDGLPASVRVIGSPTLEGRVPTFLLDFADRDAEAISVALADRDINAGAHDSFYCIGLKERIDLQPALRIGLFHYTTAHEVDRLLDALHELAA